MVKKDWLANLIIAGTVDEEAKKEHMKIDNPDMEKMGKAANTHEKQQNSLKPAANTSNVFQIKTNSNPPGNKPITCYACGETGHKSIECKKNKESLKCTKCKKTGQPRSADLRPTEEPHREGVTKQERPKQGKRRRMRTTP